MRSLLTLHQLEAEKAVQAESVELASLTQQIVDDAALEAGQRGCRVQARLAMPSAVRGNRELLRRAIENVVRNAVRFTADGTSVEVELRREAQQALLTVRDHGPGVPTEALERIFKPFYRVEGDRARQSGGTGLGLAITERAVALHGGRVLAENHAQSGLVVTLELPLDDAEPPRIYDVDHLCKAPLASPNGAGELAQTTVRQLTTPKR